MEALMAHLQRQSARDEAHRRRAQARTHQPTVAPPEPTREQTAVDTDGTRDALYDHSGL
jgi:hypothetical protein